jgi:hypothetical protein
MSRWQTLLRRRVNSDEDIERRDSDLLIALGADGVLEGVRVSSMTRHAELGEFGRNSASVRGRVHLLVDERDSAVGADIERPPGGKRLIGIDDAVGRGDGFGRIAEKGIIHAERSGKRGVGLRKIDADREEGHIERANLVPTLTE